MKHILIDTNILIHSKNASSPDHLRAKNDLIKFAIGGYQLCVCPQVLRECYKVMTTPTASRGLGLMPTQAHVEITDILTAYTLTVDSNQVFTDWQNLVNSYSVSGKNAHDTNIVACMKTNGIDDILTYNPNDFKRFTSFITIHS